MSMDYSKILCGRVQEIQPSGIRKFFDMLDGMEDVVALTVGQPDFVTPWHIRAVGIESLESGKTYYTSNSGTPELRRAIASYLSRRFSVEYRWQDEVVVTVGGSEAIDLAIRAMVEQGDEVIIPEPCFVCYAPLVRMAGGVPVPIATKEENQFKLTPKELTEALTERTKLLVLPYPNNPTGAIMERADLEAIAAVLRDTNVMILSDEIYAELTYGGNQHVSIAAVDGMWERTVLVSGFAKAYAMTGWRLGYLCAPEPLARQMLKIHQYGIMCASTTSQIAAVEALENGDADVRAMTEEYDRRRKYLVHRLRKMGMPCFEPKGAFYVFPNISGFGMSSEAFCEMLLREYKVAFVPGTAFGVSGEGFARISYAYSLKHIETALDRVEQMMKDRNLHLS